MNGKMYEHPAVQNNLAILKNRGALIIEPVNGELACGYVGKGKLAPVDTIVTKVLSLFS